MPSNESGAYLIHQKINALALGNEGRMINSAKQPNVEFCGTHLLDAINTQANKEKRPHILSWFVRATCDIKPNQELFIEYGEKYWARWSEMYKKPKPENCS